MKLTIIKGTKFKRLILGSLAGLLVGVAVIEVTLAAHFGSDALVQEMRFLGSRLAPGLIADNPRVFVLNDEKVFIAVSQDAPLVKTADAQIAE